MKRFFKVFVLLIVILFLLVSGMNRALDRLSTASDQSTISWYNDKGEEVLAYNGDIAALHAKPAPVAPRAFFHRT